MNIIKFLEWFRCVCVAVGFYLAYQPHYTKESAIYTLLLWIVIPLAGSTGIESVFFASSSAISKNREVGSAYQTQSGLNNLAVAMAGFIVWYWHWGLYAGLSVLMVLYIFLTLSSIYHLIEYFKPEKRRVIHLARFVFTSMIWLGSFPLFYSVLV